jgi:hypothetical protein
MAAILADRDAQKFTLTGMLDAARVMAVTAPRALPTVVKRRSVD